MQRNSCARRLAGVLCLVAAPSFAQDEVPAVIVTGTPLGSGLFEFVSPADVLAGPELVRRRGASLGETLQGLPGVSSTYFGPFSSRPVIRGLDADRIRILQNGIGTLDASSLSFDHAVPYDPLAAERIEVVRGPAAVLYGGNAVGGVVNVIDNRIPETPLSRFTGRAEARAGGADRERSAGVVLEGGNGTVAFHADGFARRTGDLRTPVGRLANSDARAEGGSLGGSVHWTGGYAGVAVQGVDANYGSIPEPDVRIDMKSERWDFAGAAGGLKWKLGRTDYEHRELEQGAVNTTFRNEGTDGRLEYVHGRLGPLEGALGVHFTRFDFSALGAEAYVPQTHTDAKGVFVYEELAREGWKLSAGARADRTEVEAPGQSRRFSTGSGALGAFYALTKAWGLAANAAVTQRAPTYYELYASGPHAATGVFEVGNAGFSKEKSRSVDAGVRWKRGLSSAGVTFFRTRFDNYIALIGSGNTRGADGELNPVDADGDEVADVSGEEILPEFVYQAVPTVLTGFEAQARWRAYEGRGTLDVELKADRVRATNRATGQPLPRIAPTRLGAALEYALGRWSARLDLVHAARQGRTAPNETPTPSYTLLDLALAYRWAFPDASLQAFVRGKNLTDETARLHTSFLKDTAPLGGRAILVGLRGSF